MAARIGALLAARRLAKIALNENPDLEFDVTLAMRQLWKDKIVALQGQIKTIVAGW